MYFWESPAVQSTGLNEYLFLTESTARYVILNYLFTALAASTCSTGALHFLLSPFISSIYLHDNNKHRVNIIDNNGSDSKSSTTSIITPKTTITLETMDLFARPKLTTVQLQDLKPSTRSLLTWTCTKQYLANHPETSPGRFWLDKRGGVGDQNAMRQIVQVIEKQDKRNRIL
ncbi:uncharacterized protein BX664DRAFT_335437 [Halteromyces radiatus]|uniref:uncharacterized protein n=1 Tax=Halteromyces radiatus TaxID=101107 RepID=UPI0022210B24|nr:uncharacterized protein BX664DRAFT_335437 [Halteromyces radiatus]KAI8086290.1 hypothetical protein BX664DRAFT_335437 [Halteromyces radiatus]